MRIGIDARLLTYRRGMGNYVYSLLSSISQIPSRHEVFLFVNAPDSRNPQALPAMPATWRLIALPGRNYAVQEQIALPVLVLKHRIDLLHCPANTFPLFLPAKVALVVTVHDVMYLMAQKRLGGRSSVYQRLGRTYRALVVRRLRRRAASLLTVSNRSAEDIASYLGVARSAVTVTYEAAPPQFRRIEAGSESVKAVRARRHLESDFILALGGVDPRKNTDAVLTAYSAFRRRSNLRHKLAIVGLPDGATARFARIAERAGLAQDVEFPGFVSEDELVSLYNSASVFVYPSRYEGFGLPVLEAMSCGTPVIASTAGAVPEVAGDAAILVDPDDTRALCDAMIAVASDTTAQRTLSAKGLLRAREFSWPRCARETLDAYERTLPHEYSVRNCSPAVSADPR